MKKIGSLLCLYVILLGIPKFVDAMQYEPPINIVFIVHVEPLPDTLNYDTRIAFLQWLEQQSLNRPNHFKLTILMNGDFAEFVCHRGDQDFFAQLEAEGHELGTHAHPLIRLGPLNWIEVGDQTYRYGTPFYDSALTEQIWTDAKTWVDQLTPNNHTLCAFPFLCSTEAELMTSHDFVADPGNRSEKGLDYLGHLVRHPFRPAGDNRLGHELEENLASPFIYVDHYAQIGNSNAHGYDCTEPAMEQALTGCYQEWLNEEMAQGDSLDYKVWTFGFLTHLWLDSPYYEQQITRFLNFIDSLYVNHYTPRNNLIAHYATVHAVVDEYLDWETSHPGQSSFSYIYPFPQIPVINEAMIIPSDLQQGSEWIEIYNPTNLWRPIAGYEINAGLLFDPNFWRIPPQSWLGPHEYAVIANNGVYFRNRYGFRPDFEVSGNTGARPLFTQGFYTLHDDVDGCALVNTDSTPPNTNTAICDGLSWGEDYMAGFSLPVPLIGQTYARDSNSTDTGNATDWSLNGNAPAPTPSGKNTASYFGPEVFVQVDPAWVPMQVGPSGGTISFIVQLGNEYSTVQTVDIWTNVVSPNGSIYGPLIVKQNRALEPQVTLTVNVNQSIPAGAPMGHYRYNVYVGDYPNTSWDLSYFYFEKMGNSKRRELFWPEPMFQGP